MDAFEAKRITAEKIVEKDRKDLDKLIKRIRKEIDMAAHNGDYQIRIDIQERFILEKSKKTIRKFRTIRTKNILVDRLENVLDELRRDKYKVEVIDYNGYAAIRISWR